jgi:hypothetical protein
MIGGTFAHPADKFAALRDVTLLRTYPYLLPGAIAAAVALAGATFGYFYLEEASPLASPRVCPLNPAQTLPSKRPHTEKERRAPDAPPPSMRAVLRSPAIRALCASGAALAFVQTAYDVVFVLFCYTPRSAGGLAFTVRAPSPVRPRGC